MFRGVQMQLAHFGQASLLGALMEGAQMQCASFERANMQGAVLAGAQLQGADLGRAQLHGAYLAGAHFQGANLDFASLEGAYDEKALPQVVDFDVESAYVEGEGVHALEDLPFERRLEDRVEKETELSGPIFSGGLSSERLKEIGDILEVAKEYASGYKRSMAAWVMTVLAQHHVGEADTSLPENAFDGQLSRVDAGNIIGFYRQSMQWREQREPKGNSA